MSFVLYFSICYSLILAIIIVGILKMYSITKRDNKKKSTFEKKTIFVIVACKNEENNIENLIVSLKNQSYPNNKYKVIIADDDSTDTTSELVIKNIHNINNFKYLHVDQCAFPSIKGKKKAISFAIDYINSEYLCVSKHTDTDAIFAFTDADCTPKADWLYDINKAFNNGFDFYAGYSPITFEKNNLFSRLKNLERASIFAVSSGGFGIGIPLTCTARNMAYAASLWNKTKGFFEIEHILSGDDDLMLHKSKTFIDKFYFSFNKNAFVNSVNDLKLYRQVHQETRRCSKFLHYPLYVQMLILIVTIFYLLILYQIVISLIYLNFKSDLLISLSLKLSFEFLLIATFLKYVNNFKLVKSFLLLEILYIPYFFFFGVMGTFGRYKWKN